MSPRNVKLVFQREVRDQLRDRRTLFMIVGLPLLLYPALGIGMLQMMTTFREESRQVVVLGADALPDEPRFLSGDGIRNEWFSGGEAQAARLVVTSDLTVETRETPTDDDGAPAKEARTSLLSSAQQIRLEIQRLTDEDSFSDEITSAFTESGIDVLVIVPEEFASGLARANAAIAAKEAVPDYPGPIVVRNSADEKSMVAAQTVADALRNWERALLSDRLASAGLPEDIHQPARLQRVDLAQEEQIAASVWSKLFPTLLIVMTVTGAFYPAIDLGAGEKERGTMETLLICPAYRSEIVLGKFLTVMLFSAGTAILNLASMGFTGQYMASMVEQLGRAGELAFPPLSALFWLLVLMLPIAALFSALCLGLATFAKSSKEGQYYLTPLLMITLGLTVFCLSPSVEINPFYSVLPVVNVALLLKGLLLAPWSSQSLYAYIVPVLVSSAGYSLLALWWAIELFGSESVLFRAAERVSPRLWLRQIIRQRQPLPSFSNAVFCFIAIMFLQFGAMRFMQGMVTASDPATTMFRMLLVQQIGIIALPAVVLTLLLTRSPRRTLRLRLPPVRALIAAIGLALVLHPLSFELSASLSGWFFPELPSDLTKAMGLLTSEDTSLWVLLGVFALAPAVCEELAFRGFVLSGLGRSGRTGLAVVGSSLAFGIMHMIPQQVFNASLLGLVLGLIAVRSGSLLACVVFHLIYNSLGVLHGYFGARVTTDGIFGYLLRHEGETLRYQPLLLAFLAVIAFRLIRWISSGPEKKPIQEDKSTSQDSVAPRELAQVPSA